MNYSKLFKLISVFLIIINDEKVNLLIIMEKVGFVMTINNDNDNEWNSQSVEKTRQNWNW